MSIYLVVEIEDIILDKQRLSELYMLLKEWVRVNNYQGISVSYNGKEITLSTGRHHGRISISIDEKGRLRIGSYPEGEHDFKRITGFELHEKIRELAIASDYIVSARENGWLIEEIDLREFNEVVNESRSTTATSVSEEVEEEQLEEVKLLI